MRTLLISGGAGFIGSAVVDQSIGTARTVILDNLHPQVHQAQSWPHQLERANSVLHLGDTTSIADWESALGDGGDDFTVVHLAAETGTGQSLMQARRHAHVNVVGVAALTDELSRSGRRPSSIVLASTRAVYGEGAWRDVDGEVFLAEQRRTTDLDARLWNPKNSYVPGVDALPNDSLSVGTSPTSVYGATKLAQEHLLTVWCRAMEVPLTILRFQNVYGPGQALQNGETGVLTWFARLAVTGQRIEVFEDGGIVRDFVHVRDAAEAIHAAADTPPRRDRILDIGSGVPRSLHDVATDLARSAGGPAPLLSRQYRAGDVRAAFAETERARREIGFAAKVSFEDGLKELLAHVQDNLRGQPANR
jgi:dTDP-L-rhamnose 4-epimerase